MVASMSQDNPSRDCGSRPNRLVSEKSPYLLQHAYNPVDWHPWGEEAFSLAKREEKPVFLSIGYSTCHWCHVMARESFEDPEVARLMNEAFVCVKVDREERPEIDQVYMAVCQMMTGRGGWPLTIIITPEKRPFFAATYIPKERRFGVAGMLELVPRIRELWESRRSELQSSADQVVEHLNRPLPPSEGRRLDEATLNEAYRGLADLFDLENGGFGRARKFPAPHNLLFLLRYWLRSKEGYALEMVEATLQAMRLGGIYDHIGFGFHRYSTDASWAIPHFEKMLYDQAMTVMAYAEAFQATGKEEYARTAREILEYVLREMTSPEGCFFSAEDADSEGMEGKFYIWRAEDLRQVLDDEEYRLVFLVFEVREDGNLQGANVLRLRAPLKDASAVLGITERDLLDRMERIRQKLFASRERRVHPSRDEKILTDWNGLMIAALAKAAQILDEPEYARAAGRAADFLLKEMRRPDGRLLHRYREGAGILGNLDDYAFLIWGLIELYEAAFDLRYLKSALELSRDLIEHFWDWDGGFYFTPDDGEALLMRRKEIYDGAAPSGNSVAMLNLLRLARITGEAELEQRAEALASSFSGIVARRPEAHTMLMASLDFALSPSCEVAIAGNLEDPGARDMLRALRSRFLPSMVVILASGEEVSEIAGFTRDLSPAEGKAAAYVCFGYRCRLPTTDPEEMLRLLDGEG
jgi:uncharacterized protein YyaL (SSP411 family)